MGIRSIILWGIVTLMISLPGEVLNPSLAADWTGPHEVSVTWESAEYACVWRERDNWDSLKVTDLDGRDGCGYAGTLRLGRGGDAALAPWEGDRYVLVIHGRGIVRVELGEPPRFVQRLPIVAKPPE